MRTTVILGWGVLVLLALLVPTPAADDYDFMYVTVAACEGRDPPGPVYPTRPREYPVDTSATYLDLQSCSLTELKEDYITVLPNITDISLFDNNIEYIDLALLRSVPTLMRLSLAGNKLRELPVFPKDSCPNLMYLDLQRNKLSAISDARTFAACTEFVFINLTDNNITYIHPHVFNSLPKLKWLELSSNQLTFLPEHMFAASLTPIHLYVSKNKLSHLPKNFAANIKQDRVDFKEFLFNENPWHCACLLELLADVKRSGVDFVSSMESNGQKPQCVFFGPFPCERSRASGLLGAPRAAE